MKRQINCCFWCHGYQGKLTNFFGELFHERCLEEVKTVKPDLLLTLRDEDQTQHHPTK